MSEKKEDAQLGEMSSFGSADGLRNIYPRKTGSIEKV